MKKLSAVKEIIDSFAAPDQSRLQLAKLMWGRVVDDSDEWPDFFWYFVQLVNGQRLAEKLEGEYRKLEKRPGDAPLPTENAFAIIRDMIREDSVTIDLLSQGAQATQIVLEKFIEAILQGDARFFRKVAKFLEAFPPSKYKEGKYWPVAAPYYEAAGYFFDQHKGEYTREQLADYIEKECGKRPSPGTISTITKNAPRKPKDTRETGKW